jgi:uncharacterized repeat protein (TIGR01451 family)
VIANGPIAVGFFGYNGNAGASGYFSGFETIPNVLVQLEGDGCLPSTILVSTEGFTSYAWYRDGNLIPDATERIYVPTIPGSYNVVVSTGTCTFESASQVIADCNPEIVLTTTANKTSAKPNEFISFKIKSKFLGFGKAENLKIAVTIPEGLIFNSYSVSYGSFTGSGNDYLWNIGTLYNGQEPILDIETKVNPSLTNSKEVTLTVSNTQTTIDANKLIDDPSETVLLLLKDQATLGKLKVMNKNVRDGTFEIKAPKSNSTGSFTYSSSNIAVASVEGSLITINGVGSSIIKVQQAEDEDYDISFSEAELIVNESNEVLMKTGEISSSKLNFIGYTGDLNDYKGITRNGGIQVAKSPVSNDPNLILWLDSDLISSYNRKNNFWYDLSQSANNGSLVNKLGFSTSNGRSFILNGTSNYISFEDNLPSTDELSLESWIYPTSFSTAGFNSICSQNGSSVGMFHFQFAENKLNLNIIGAESVSSNYVFSPNQWYHIVAVYSKSKKTVQFYVNGTLTNEASTGLESPSIQSNSFEIGSWQSSSRFFKGNIGVFKIYTRILEANEVFKNFENDYSRFIE